MSKSAGSRRTLLIIALSLGIGCGGGGGNGGGSPTSPPMPAPPSSTQVSGVWSGDSTSTNQDTNFCYGGGNATVSVTWTFSQSGNDVTAEIAIESIRCTFVGSVSGNSLSMQMNTSNSNTVCYRRNFLCNGANYREELVVDQSHVTATVSGSTMSMEGQSLSRIYPSGSANAIGEHRSSNVTNLVKR